MNRFSKFDDRARAVLTFAQEEALRHNHNYIGTEHLLLGLIRERDGVATRMLETMGVELPKLRTAVEFILDRGERPATGEVGLTFHAKRVIELAIDEARRLGDRHIGGEHLLIGLAREEESVAARVLVSFGVTVDAARDRVGQARPNTFDVTAGTRNVAPMVFAGMLPPDEARRVREISARFVDVMSGGLRRVVGIGQVASDAGVTIELIALEIRELGCVLYWKARTEGGRRLGEPVFILSDDVGTEYAVGPGGWTSSGGETKGESVVVPAPPENAATVHIEVSGFAGRTFAPSAPLEEVRGRWRFDARM